MNSTESPKNTSIRGQIKTELLIRIEIFLFTNKPKPGTRTCKLFLFVALTTLEQNENFFINRSELMNSGRHRT